MPDDEASSPFLAKPRSEWVAENALAFAIRDGFPVSPGHTLVVPKRVIPSWFDATREEQLAIVALVEEVKTALETTLAPQGYNIGVNVGAAAGQTVLHMHVHVIPRFAGDVDDPRGGVRHVIPSKGNYLRETRPPLAVGGPADPFLAHVAPLFSRARDIAILAAFIQDSGLSLVRHLIEDALVRGTRIRILTGDYLEITQATALERLLDWTQLAHLMSDVEGDALEGAHSPGALETRVIRTALLPGASQAFHPKSWRFEGDGFATAFVGSSNLSRSALTDGIEWNLRADRDTSPDAYHRIVESFEALWNQALPLDSRWVAEYANRARSRAITPPLGEIEVEPIAKVPPPHPIQEEALRCLAASRGEGRQRALVVMATGLGKTWLTAFDLLQYARELGRFPRVLFVAHREEILEQAARTLRTLLRVVLPNATIGWLAASEDESSSQVVLASVQKLSRQAHLSKQRTGAFDYVVIDEVHHATAASYRRILNHFSPQFLLGLTATPDRADEADVLGLFDDHLAFRADIGVGIRERLLVPFAYQGLKDDVDYANIPWRNRRFDPEMLARACETESRMARMWEAWNTHPGTRTLVFCCSIDHADYASRWLAARGVRVVAVHSGPTSAERTWALASLENGTLDAVCAVDLFNEGIDVPLIDRVVMLRPTESPVVFMQQLGRGLRVARESPDAKKQLAVIDFVGNHKVFLERLRRLLDLAPVEQGYSVSDFLRHGLLSTLPPGCSIDVELEAKELLIRLLTKHGGADEVKRAYLELAEEHGRRPTAGEMVRLGFNPRVLRPWFEFVSAQGHLTQEEEGALQGAREWLNEVESTSMTKCFKMVTLQALLDANALDQGLSIAELSHRSHQILMRSPELASEIEDVQALENPREPEPEHWEAYWRKNPIAAWSSGRWFTVEGGMLLSHIPAIADRETLAAMTQELVDYRLAKYRRERLQPVGDAFECKVLWNQRDPILKLPSRKTGVAVPQGDTEVRTPAGAVWRFRFTKEFCYVATPVGVVRNQLPDLLRSWFGPAAGRPGTSFFVRFSPSPDGWWVEPAAGQIVELPRRAQVIAFPTLRVAAGAPDGALDANPEASAVSLPLRQRGNDYFAVRASGDSMDGGSAPIRDGDWLVMRFARGRPLAALDGKVALVQITSRSDSLAFQVKRVVRDAEGWELRSNNPQRPSFRASEDTVPIAVLAEVVRPEALAPAVGSRIADEDLAGAFGVSSVPSSGRIDAHLFFKVEDAGRFVEPDRLRLIGPTTAPGETAFVLARPPGERMWRYCGVARWNDGDNAWEVPELDFATWRGLGGTRSVSRRLPQHAMEAAHELCERLIREYGPGEWLGDGERRCRLVGPAKDGGIRIDGGGDGFRERTVSLTDFAWVLAAKEDAARSGGPLDEARVNRVRYLEGTPKGSTRWIDSRWALLIVGWLESDRGRRS